MQSENRWVVAGDLLFPAGGYQLDPDSEAILSQYVPQLRSLQNTKIAVYGFTDNLPVGPALKRTGVSNNIDLVAASRQRCRVFRSQGVNPISCRPKASAKRVR
jgi:chemotaxis protein MotB